MEDFILNNWKYIIACSLLLLLIYKIFYAFYLLDKNKLVRNLIVIVVINILIYLTLFFTNKNVTIDDILTLGSLKYFFGYLIFSLLAFFITSPIFIRYKNEIKIKGFSNSFILKYFIEAIIYVEILYFVFVVFINKLLKQDLFYSSIYNYLLVGLISSLFFIVFYFLEKRRFVYEDKIIKESLKAETANANFETLKNQIDPHFLFNSLNVLTSLIEENPKVAIDFTNSLSKIYRYVLEQKDKEIIPLSEELNFAKTFYKLLKLRFEDAIELDFNEINFTEDEFIVPLSLQILLENAVKHNITSSNKPLKIKIYRTENFLVVENNLQLKSSTKNSLGIGLNNIVNRYNLITKSVVQIEKSHQLFVVKLPILTKNKYTMETQLNNKEFAYQRAIIRAKELKKFYFNFGTYIIMSLFFFVLNYLTAKGHWWFYWPMLGWGVGVAMHALKVFGFGTSWEDNKAKEIFEKEQHKNIWK